MMSFSVKVPAGRLATIVFLVIAVFEAIVLPAPSVARVPPRELSFTIGRDVNATEVAAAETNPAVTQLEEDVCAAASGDHCGPGTEGADDGEFNFPGHVAVNESTGALYIADWMNDRVEELNPTGAFVAAWGWGVSNGALEYQVCVDHCEGGDAGPEPGQFSEPRGISVDNSGDAYQGDVYVTDFGNNRVEVFSANGAFLTQFNGAGGPRDFNGPSAVAVAPATGDVYVADQKNRVVDEYRPEPEGANQVNFMYLGQDDQTAGGRLTQPTDVAVAADGTVYVTNARSTLVQFNPGDEVGSEVVPADARAVAVDPETGNAYILAEPEPETYVVQAYESTGVEVAEFPLGPGVLFGESASLAVNGQTGTIALVDARDNAAYVMELAPLPGVKSGSAESVTETTAALGGTVEPDGFETTYLFEYGSGEAFGTDAPLTPASAGASATPVPVTAAVTGLKAGTTYYYRIVASNAFHTSKGVTREFKTLLHPPTAITHPATDVTRTSALLSGEVNPEGSESTYSIRYTQEGSCASCGVPVIVTGSSGNAAGTSSVPVSAVATGLTPNARYEYEVVASNAGGTVSSAPMAFVTVPLSPAAKTLGVGEVGEESAVVHGAIDPEGSDTTYRFEYGPTASYGSVSRAPEADAGSSSTYGDVSTEIAGLAPGTTYHWRLVATNNKSGTPQATYSEDGAFTTGVSDAYPGAPTALTGGAADVSETGATLTGTTTVRAAAATYWFEYGPTVYYGAAAPLAGHAVEGATNSASLSEAVAGLHPGSRYYYRLVVNSLGGTAYGEGKTFTTAPAVLAPSIARAPRTKPTTTTTEPKPLTKAQSLKAALKLCHKDKSKRRRATCEQQARKHYATKPKLKPTKTKTTTKGSK
jgi:DNA-binding beta-propeller fold protein YncE